MTNILQSGSRRPLERFKGISGDFTGIVGGLKGVSGKLRGISEGLMLYQEGFQGSEERSKEFQGVSGAFHQGFSGSFKTDYWKGVAKRFKRSSKESQAFSGGLREFQGLSGGSRGFRDSSRTFQGVIEGFIKSSK